MLWRQYLKSINEGKYDNKLMSYKNINVNINLKNSENLSHVEDRLKQRSGLTLDQFKDKIKLVIDRVKETGTYVAVLNKSKIKIPFRYTKSRNDMYIFTILDISMTAKDFDYKIDLNEYIFKTFNIELNKNEYVAYEQGFRSVIQFMNENNEMKCDGIEILEINE